MTRPSTSDNVNEQANEPRRRWQFRLRHWFGFSAEVVFLLGFTIALYPVSVLALAASVGGGVALVLARLDVYSRRPRAFTRDLIAINFGYVFVTVGLWSVSESPELGWTRHCRNNLKQIMQAMQCYHTAYGCFPPAYVADANGRPMHSWRTLLLPYLQRTNIYSQYRWDEPWDGPNNRKLRSVRVPEYECPAQSAAGPAMVSYVAVVGSETAWTGATSTKISDFRDGTSNTIMIVETANSGIHWMEPRDLEFASIPIAVCPTQGGGISSVHHTRGRNRRHLGAFVATGDVSVRWLSPDTPEAGLRALLTRAGGESPDRYPPP